MVAYRRIQFGPEHYSTKVFFNQISIAYLDECTGDYEDPTLFKLECLDGGEKINLEIQWGNAHAATQMHGIWVSGERSIIFSKISD